MIPGQATRAGAIYHAVDSKAREDNVRLLPQRVTANQREDVVPDRPGFARALYRGQRA